MIKNVEKGSGILAGLFLLSGPIILWAQLLPQSKPTVHTSKGTTHHTAAKKPAPPSSDKVIRFVREKFGVPDKVAMIMDPFHESADPAFLESTLTSDDGLNTKTSKHPTVIGVSKDSHYLVMSYAPVGTSAFLHLDTAAKDEIIRGVRGLFHVPENISVTVGAFQNSAFPGIQKVPLESTDGKNKSEPEAYLSRDHHDLILGGIFDLRVDPRRDALSKLVLQNQSETGSRNAPVTIVEFADLECPTCARAHEFLEKNLLPTYAGKIRLVFKDFPLPMHEWALPAAIANQCAYRINPANYEPYRTLIFAHQTEFEAIKGNASEIRDKLIDFGQQVGLDHLQLAGCIDSKASLPRVEADVKEGKSINVTSTPTFFINGRILIGAQPENFYAAVDDALQESKKKK